MNTQLAIKESDLELVVSEKTLGSLTTNAIQIRDMVKSTLPMYDISNYNDDNIDQAKRDKAAPNTAFFRFCNIPTQHSSVCNIGKN